MHHCTSQTGSVSPDRLRPKTDTRSLLPLSSPLFLSAGLAASHPSNHCTCSHPPTADPRQWLWFRDQPIINQDVLLIIQARVKTQHVVGVGVGVGAECRGRGRARGLTLLFFFFPEYEVRRATLWLGSGITQFGAAVESGATPADVRIETEF